jgi:nitroreductase
VLQQIGKLARTGAYIAQAPLAVAVAIENTKYAVSDASRAIQSMILTAWADGVASNWVGFSGLDEIKPLLGIPKEMDLLAIVPFGYAAQAHTGGKKKRKPLGEVVNNGKFGQPFA